MVEIMSYGVSAFVYVYLLYEMVLMHHKIASLQSEKCILSKSLQIVWNAKSKEDALLEWEAFDLWFDAVILGRGIK